MENPSVQETSLLAFDSIQAKLPKARLEVLNKLLALGEATNAEISKSLGWTINRVTPRVLELRQQKLVVFSKARICSISGRPAMAWKVNDSVNLKVTPVSNGGGEKEIY